MSEYSVVELADALSGHPEWRWSTKNHTAARRPDGGLDVTAAESAAVLAVLLARAMRAWWGSTPWLCRVETVDEEIRVGLVVDGVGAFLIGAANTRGEALAMALACAWSRKLPPPEFSVLVASTTGEA